MMSKIESFLTLFVFVYLLCRLLYIENKEEAMRPTQDVLTDQDLTDALENQDLENQEDLRLMMERRNGPTTWEKKTHD